jgi:hypothetical protein
MDRNYLARSGRPSSRDIVTNLSRPAERVVAFYNKRGTAQPWIKECKGAIKWTRLSCMSFRGPCSAAPAQRTRLTSRQIPADTGHARTDQGLVANELEGKADQNRRAGGSPGLRRLSDGRGRHFSANIPGGFCASSRSNSRRHHQSRPEMLNDHALESNRREWSPNANKKEPDQPWNHLENPGLKV